MIIWKAIACVFAIIACAESEAPHFDESFATINFESGSYGDIVCAANGNPVPTYKWHYEEREIQCDTYNNSTGISCKSQNNYNVSSLEFFPVNVNHSGIYTCTAENRDGVSSKLFRVVVNETRGEPPSFDISFENITLKDGYNGQVLCVANGYPRPTYTWYDDEGEVPCDVQHNMTVSCTSRYYNGSLLKFRPAVFYYSGMYECKAENLYGAASKHFNIFINDTDSIDNQTDTIKQVAFEHLSESAVLILVTTNVHHNYLYVNYSEKVEGISRRQTLMRNSPGGGFVLKDLIPSGSYNIQMKIASEEKWSNFFSFVMRPGVPEVFLNSLSGGLLRIEWTRTFTDYLRSTIDEYVLSYYTLQYSNETWIPSDCSTDVHLKRGCSGYYTIADLTKGQYEIQLKAHTSQGYGPPYKQKVHIL